MRYSPGIKTPTLVTDHLETDFEKDVLLGLSSGNKWLSSKYFYNQRGDEIFQKIMAMPSYYLTNCELEIFQNYSQDILDVVEDGSHFNLIELGAGDGTKTKLLLRSFLDQNVDFTYSPVDISSNILINLEEELIKEMPELKLKPLNGDYFHVLADLLEKEVGKVVLMFLGGNIGNFNREGALNFLQKIRSGLKANDQLILGFDNKKEPDVILEAYDDDEGITAAFNYNLLQRINDELGGNFNIENFRHRPIYDPQSGECRSYLMSTKDQEVYIGKLDTFFQFEKWETIFTEISKKYSIHEMQEILEISGFELIKVIQDNREYFSSAICKAIEN